MFIFICPIQDCWDLAYGFSFTFILCFLKIYSCNKTSNYLYLEQKRILETSNISLKIKALHPLRRSFNQNLKEVIGDTTPLIWDLGRQKVLHWWSLLVGKRGENPLVGVHLLPFSKTFRREGGCLVSLKNDIPSNICAVDMEFMTR
ncbi:hypothetical protein NC652_007703 [Populus alba x Populus x berolinensis]|nr:hypothetical protein NC652_007703 [Populus alba x Populus x berolinensis]